MASMRYGALLATVALLATAGCGENKDDSTTVPAAKAPVAATSSADPQALASASAAASEAPAPVATTQAASAIDFGDDDGEWSRDGECDDKRFQGPGMTDTPLLDSDIKHDATDCRTAYNQGRLTLISASEAKGAPESDRIIWGEDRGKIAKDGECDDKRFQGPGMAADPLSDADIKGDASDCRAAFQQGRITLRDQ